MPRYELPAPAELAQNPELAILDALDHDAELALRALVAMHPELADHERPYWVGTPSPLCDCAVDILERIYALRDALERYRRRAQPRG